MYLAEAHALDPPAHSIRKTVLVGTQPHLCVSVRERERRYVSIFQHFFLQISKKSAKERIFPFTSLMAITRLYLKSTSN